MDLFDPVDVSNQIPASFFTQIESKKWSDRKEALEIIEKVTSVPKILNTDLSELIRALKKIVSKDSNIVVATLAAKCLCQLAQGLRTDFAPYANSSLQILFEKFKEKKPNVNSVIRDATDAAFVGTSLEGICEDIIKFLDNKNPQIRSEVALFLCRIFSKFPAQVMNKKVLKQILGSLMKTLSDMDATVRDNSAMAIGTAMKVIGENLMMPLIADVEPIKISKIKEFCEKAEIHVETNGQIHVAAPCVENGHPIAPTNGVADEEPDDENSVYDMLDAVDISNQIPASFFTQIESKKWSDRKEALEIIEKVTSVPKISNTDLSELIRALKKIVSKDSNIVVATLAAKCLCQIAQGLRADFSPYANSSLQVLFEKFKEKKPSVNSVIRDATDAAFVGTNLEETCEDIIKFLDNKNPQIRSEMALFLSRIFAKFPAQVMNKKVLKQILSSLMKTLSDMDATVRDNSAMAIGTAMKVIGENLMMPLIADVEPIKITKIKEFSEKAQVKKISASALAAAQPAPAPPTNNHVPPPTRSSSATMIRSTSKKPQPRASLKPVSSIPGSNATVKRTATIIKRSTVPKRGPAGSNAAQPPVASHPAPPPPSQPAPAPQPVIMAPPQQQQIQQPTLPSTPVMPVYSTTMQAPKFAPALKQDNNLDMVIFRLISDNHDEVMDSLSELEDTLTDITEPLFKKRINQIIDLSCLQLIKSIYSQRTATVQGDEQSLKVKRVSDCLIKIFARKQLVTAASQHSIRFLLVQIFTLTQTIKSEDEIADCMHNLSSAIMDSFEPTNMMCVLTGLLNDPSPTSIVEPIKKAIIRSMRSFK